MRSSATVFLQLTAKNLFYEAVVTNPAPYTSIKARKHKYALHALHYS